MPVPVWALLALSLVLAVLAGRLWQQNTGLQARLAALPVYTDQALKRLADVTPRLAQDA